MEADREELPKVLAPGAERKPKRFRIVKLEERIAPSSGGGSKNCTNKCYTGWCVYITDCCHGATYAY